MYYMQVKTEVYGKLYEYATVRSALVAEAVNKNRGNTIQNENMIIANIRKRENVLWNIE